MLKVAFFGAMATSLADRIRARLTVPCELTRIEPAGVASGLAGVDVLVSLAFDAGMAATADRLRLLQVPGAGLDRIDRGALPPGVALANAFNHETGIAEFVLGALLTLTWGFAALDAGLRRGEWPGQWMAGRPLREPWPNLAGKRLGVLGYGRIGQAVAERARGFGMHIVGLRRSASASAGEPLQLVGGLDRLDQLLSRSDHLVVALPSSPETRGILGARELGLLRPTALLVNVGRGEVIDEDALYEALTGRRIAGAALDVWYRYPTGTAPTMPSRRPFHELANVLMTPHVSGWTEATLDGRATLIAGNIARISRGEAPLNLIPPAL